MQSLDGPVPGPISASARGSSGTCFLSGTCSQAPYLLLRFVFCSLVSVFCLDVVPKGNVYRSSASLNIPSCLLLGTS